MLALGRRPFHVTTARRSQAQASSIDPPFGARPRARLLRSAAAAVVLAAVFTLLACVPSAGAAVRRIQPTVSIAARYQEQGASVPARVTVLDQKGRPVAGAQVTLRWLLPSGTRLATRHTDAAGVARQRQAVGDVAPGSRVWVSARCCWRGQTRRCRTWFVVQHPVPDTPSLVFVGDSLTVGMFALDETRCFRSLVASHFGWSSFYTAGYGGQSKDADRQKVTDARGDVVVVELGTNDASGYPTNVPVGPAVFEKNLRAVADAARAGNEDCRLVFLTVWQLAPRRTAYDRRIAAVAADYGGHLVRLAAIRDDPADSGPAGVSTTFGVSDGAHPNDAGHAAIAAAVESVIRQLARTR
jgi:lysophospholipase L1-like esterase